MVSIITAKIGRSQGRQSSIHASLLTLGEIVFYTVISCGTIHVFADYFLTFLLMIEFFGDYLSVKVLSRNPENLALYRKVLVNLGAERLRLELWTVPVALYPHRDTGPPLTDLGGTAQVTGLDVHLDTTQNITGHMFYTPSGVGWGGVDGVIHNNTVFPLLIGTPILPI